MLGILSMMHDSNCRELQNTYFNLDCEGNTGSAYTLKLSLAGNGRQIVEALYR
jgi:hypothetical protein